MDLAGQIGRILDADMPSGETSPQARDNSADHHTTSSSAASAADASSSGSEAEMATLGFNTYGYSRFLKKRGVRPDDAEALAEATDHYVMGPLLKRALTAANMIDAEVATKADAGEIVCEIQMFRQEARGDVADVDRKLDSLHQESLGAVAEVDRKLDAFHQESREAVAEVDRKLDAFRQECTATFTAFRQEFTGEIAQIRLEIQVAAQRAIITFGVMLAAAVGILSATIGFFN